VVAVLISALLIFATARIAVRTGADVAGKAVAGATSRTNNPMDTVLDAILGPSTGALSQNMVASTSDEIRGELSRILAVAPAMAAGE
jgi:hypothetical protein